MLITFCNPFLHSFTNILRPISNYTYLLIFISVTARGMHSLMSFADPQP